MLQLHAYRVEVVGQADAEGDADTQAFAVQRNENGDGQRGHRW